MSSERLNAGDLDRADNSMDLSFISNPQFTAVKQHYETVLKQMEKDDNLRGLRVELSKLLQLFQSCYKENERKTHKIFELAALNAVQVPELKSLCDERQKSVEDLKNTIRNLQKNLDDTNQQRIKLLEETQVLKKAVDLENKLIQVRAESLENVPQDTDQNVVLESKSSKGTATVEQCSKDVATSEKEVSQENFVADEDPKITNCKVLKNNLQILVADLKLARQKIEELKKEIYVKDSLAKDIWKDFSTSEMKAAQTETKLSETKKPIEVNLDRLRAELDEKCVELDDTSKELHKTLATMATLEKDIASKNSTIEILKTRVKELDSTKETGFRKAEIFEKHLVEIQSNLEEKKREIEVLADEVKVLQKPIPDIVPTVLDTDKGRSVVNIHTLESTIDTLKNNISSRDKKINEMQNELKNAVGMLQIVKTDLVYLEKEKASLAIQLDNVKKRLKERNEEARQLIWQLNDARKEVSELKREIRLQTKKYQQAVDKRNKFHNMCNHLKIVNDEKRNENKILGKRQEYLVKMLKEKDMEIEKIVTWKNTFAKQVKLQDL